MGLLDYSKLTDTPKFFERFKKQKQEKSAFIANEKEFSSKQRIQVTGHRASALIESVNLIVVPDTDYLFITNVTLSVTGSAIDRGDGAIYYAKPNGSAINIVRLIPEIGTSAQTAQTFNHPIRVAPGGRVFTDNLIAQQFSATVFGFLVPRKEIDREILAKYG